MSRLRPDPCPHFSYGWEFTHSGWKRDTRKSVPMCRMKHDYCGKVVGYSAYRCPLEAEP